MCDPCTSIEVAQAIAQRHPYLVRKLILAGTGPAAGTGITRVTRLSNLALLRGALTRQDPKKYLFFTRTANGRRAADEFLARLQERTQDRDTHRQLRRPGRTAAEQ
ncbi:hypothetical protein [Catellatospora tritici]|uniref:hypothetical protein n=1 Tax=Catellatospora tritici TaxID=2851566 RepID=UPI001C2DC5D2|nr:hypothetical protein [Catellatospora tritici]MBV1854320.1 hypothetical protein [Catellatospora tritici]